jgi:hypothetical protein
VASLIAVDGEVEPASIDFYEQFVQPDIGSNAVFRCKLIRTHELNRLIAGEEMAVLYRGTSR